MAPAKTPRRTQDERSRQTTGQLLAAARELFAADGYAATSLDAIAEAAGVTKGAVYHHFESKRAIFRAVYAAEQKRLARLAAAAAERKRDPLDAFYEGCRAFLEVSLDPGVQRITLLDAPGALGWETMREIESDSLRMTQNGIEIAMKSGRLPKGPSGPLAHMLFGALCEAAMKIARAENPKAETRVTLRQLRALLDGLAAQA